MRSEPSAVGPPTSGVLQTQNRRPRIRGGLPAWRARRVTAYIDAHLAGRVSVAGLARLTGLSAGHFSRAFKQSFGVSARTFLRRRRIELAQGMLLSTDLHLNEIAYCCGLCDQPHLSKMFRGVVGENPSAWRRAHCDTWGP
jgi:AraC-like DNA-binding protein